MATVDIDGFSLYYEVYGDGEPLVFAHGVGGNHAHWYHQVDFFSRTHRVVVFDHRGFGNSRDEGGGGRSRFVEDLRALLDHLEIQRATLVAQSMGGGTCVGFTRLYPDRVRALVLADTLIGFALPDDIARENQISRQSAEILGQVERVLGETTRARNPKLARLYVAMSSFNMVNRHNLEGSFGIGCTPDELSATGIPIQFLVGSEDVLAPPNLVRELHSLILGSHYAEVPKSGHSVYFEAPDDFNRIVSRFLLSLDGI